MTSYNPASPLTYRHAGVDVDAGNRLVERIKPLAAATNREGVLSGLGGFGALFELPLHRYRAPILVSGTDGVGTKLRLAIEAKTYDTVGIDLVAMCVNDILAQGAEPLFFLDYFSTGKLNIDVAEAVVRGIARGCQLGNVALIGGETAEMPGMYAKGDFDLAGFSVGIVERDRIVDGAKTRPGDRLIALPSSGPHSNGFSLIRKILELSDCSLETRIADRTLRELLLEPTRIYVNDLTTSLAGGRISGIAHITGGGLTENIARVLPGGCTAVLERERWTMPPLFSWLQAGGNLTDDEMYRTFNCGIGMTITVHPEDAEVTLSELRENGTDAFETGYVTAAHDTPPVKIV